MVESGFFFVRLNHEATLTDFRLAVTDSKDFVLPLVYISLLFNSEVKKISHLHGK